MIKGQIISGNFGSVVLRQKSDQLIELGELLVANGRSGKILLQVYDLEYASQLSKQNMELVSGMNLEEDEDLEFMDPNIRTYNLVMAKPLVSISNHKSSICKELPIVFSNVYSAGKDDLTFLAYPERPLVLGNLRSGSKILDVDISLEGDKVLSEHVLIPAATGKGKSNLCSVILWNALPEDYCGFLVLDPHDEYYGRSGIGLKDHPQNDKVSYYTSNNPPPGARSLKINFEHLTPRHFNGVVYFSDPQMQAMSAYYKHYGKKWVEAVLRDKELPFDFNEATIQVLKRRLASLLDLEIQNSIFVCRGVFDTEAGMNTIGQMIDDLEDSKAVIIDTSNFSSSIEILIGSIVANEIFRRYKRYKITGEIDRKPVISIVLEEAPRVLGKEVLESGPNVFSTIAREGRKFKVGLFAITQLPSLIPRSILANMNTKIILGIEMAPERSAIIDSASQDLSSDARNIASLDKGEAIITSNFAKFATPIKIPYFPDVVKETQNQHVRETHKVKDERFSGMKLR
ncbi:ATP-binding protein [Candidatus Woesearchaeota archaeon]|nr:ATP-binding protein [Candidatus Woesearchaeota archaeon]